MRISDWSSDVCSSDLIAGILTPRASRQFEHRAIEGGAIVVGQIDEARLLDEAAQLDQVAGPFLASHHPFPAVMAALSGFSSERRLLEFRLRPEDGLHYRRQLCARAAERRQRHRSATPPDFLRPVLRRQWGAGRRPAQPTRTTLPGSTVR